MTTSSQATAGATASGVLAARASGPELLLDVGNDLAATGPVLESVREHLAAQGAGERGIYNAELVVEEIFTNAVKHGIAGTGPQRIGIRVVVSADTISLEFDDPGREFDPTQHAAPAPPASLSEAKIGGLGLKLVKKLSRTFLYRREGGRNLLTVTLATN